MLKGVRLLSAVIGGVAGVGMAYLAIYLAEFPPSGDKARSAYVFGAAATCIIWVASVAAFWFCENRLDDKREQRESERDANSRQMMRLIGSLLPPMTGTANVTLVPATVQAQGTVSSNGQTLRQAGLNMAKGMRDWAIANAARKGDLLLEDFWKTYPFKSYDDLKERFKIHLGKWNVESAATILPMTPERIRELADNIEAEASKIPSDIPL